MDNIKAIESLGFTMPTPAYFAGAFLFGILGFAAYRYGKKSELPVPKWIGVALMLFPYAISDTLLLYAIGSGLCIGAYMFRHEEF